MIEQAGTGPPILAVSPVCDRRRITGPSSRSAGASRSGNRSPSCSPSAGLRSGASARLPPPVRAGPGGVRARRRRRVPRLGVQCLAGPGCSDRTIRRRRTTASPARQDGPCRCRMHRRAAGGEQAGRSPVDQGTGAAALDGGRRRGAAASGGGRGEWRRALGDYHRHHGALRWMGHGVMPTRASNSTTGCPGPLAAGPRSSHGSGRSPRRLSRW